MATRRKRNKVGTVGGRATIRSILQCGVLSFALCLPVLAMAAASPGLETLLQQAEEARSSDPHRFQRLLGELEQHIDRADKAQREQIEYLRAYGFSFRGHYDEAIRHARALMASSTNPEIQFRAGALIVNTHALRRQFTDGLRQLEQTLTLVDKIQSAKLRHHGLGVASYLYNQVGQYRLGLRYADRILEEEPDARTLCFANQARFDSLYNLGELPSDDDVVVEAINQCDASHETVTANGIRLILAKKWAESNRRKQAIALMDGHLKEIEETGYTHLIAQVKAFLAELLLDAGEYAAAETYANESLAQNTPGSTSSLASAYKTMYQIAEARKDSETALVYYRRYAEADRAYLNEVKARELAYQMVRQEILEKSQQIQRLDSQNQLLKLQRKVEKQAGQNTRLIIILLVVLLATIAYWAYKTKRVQVSLKHLAETDALTGICNRHHFTQSAGRMLSQCERNGEEVAVIMFDLDHFKSINDRFGHPAGDWVLKQVAQVCQSLCRRIDVLGRLGGEEFAMLMYGCDLRSAIRLAEDCRTRIASIDTSEIGQRIQVTASFGVTSTAMSGYVLQRLLSDADRMLYQSKAQGRNRVTAFRAASQDDGEVSQSGTSWTEMAETQGARPG
ncbi:GGDEF domain-containing protein [Pseudomonas sp. R2.Fl]|nr:GGDEF domain-containing protein [Pseudomonas sp. R2.Fl]